MTGNSSFSPLIWSADVPDDWWRFTVLYKLCVLRHQLMHLWLIRSMCLVIFQWPRLKNSVFFLPDKWPRPVSGVQVFKGLCQWERFQCWSYLGAFYGFNNNKPRNPNLHQINDTREFPHINSHAKYSVPGKLESSVKTKLDFCDSSRYFEISCKINCYSVDSDTTYVQMWFY